jgi:hypothetical protein
MRPMHVGKSSIGTLDDFLFSGTLQRDILDALEKTGMSAEDALQTVIEIKEQGYITYRKSEMQVVRVVN